jgi:hypothetical protein
VSPAGDNSCTAKQRVEQREGRQSQVDRCRHSPTANNMKRATDPLTAHQFPAAYSLKIYRRHPDTTFYGNCALPRLDASTAGSVELAVCSFGAECGNNSVRTQLPRMFGSDGTTHDFVRRRAAVRLCRGLKTGKKASLRPASSLSLE